MKVVLLDSDFTHLPQVVMEGRKVIHNVTRTAGGVFYQNHLFSTGVILLPVCQYTVPVYPDPDHTDRRMYRGMAFLCDDPGVGYKKDPGLIPEKRPVSCHALWCDCCSDDRHRQPCGADISLAAAFLLDIVRQTAVKE